MAFSISPVVRITVAPACGKLSEPSRKGTSSVMEQGATARAGTELLDESSFVGELI
jgi:hypothetical protein